MNILNPIQSIRKKGYQHLKITIESFDRFINNLRIFKSRICIGESEGYHQGHLMDLFKNSYYSPDYLVAHKDKIDFVIHSASDPKSPAFVLFEVKTITNKSEMITTSNLNRKAMQEILLYYLRERIEQNNLELKYLVVTNTEEFFLFDAHEFERLFYNNTKLKKEFSDFTAGRLSGKKNDFFYQNIARKYIEEAQNSIEYVHFNLNDYTRLLDKSDDKSRNKLSTLYKIFSPDYLLKKPIQQDHNSLNKHFYTELLYIIGLEEVVIDKKKIIRRLEVGKRNNESIIENTITKLDIDESLSKINNFTSYGSDKDEQLFNVALELSITWINRILFLKLLEAQLIRYNRGDASKGFLNPTSVKNYDDLYELFFQILAVKYENRRVSSDIPYLNSSLFEISKLEHNTIKPSNLNNELTLKVLSSTVLKEKRGKLRYKELPTLEYLLRFLDAYDFGAESECEVQDANKTLISASVLGLIFEKINGYKDGAIFTPSFVTMYMCRESISRVVINKFNAHYNWNCTQINDVHNKLGNTIEEIKEANKIIDSITICDPAVGSGHFLVSALNEIIRIKDELGILIDSEGKRIKGYGFDIINDELIITDEDGSVFIYNKSKESQRLQETIFKEKRKIIENCLFGVDINPNSVNICRLRLWIELLKNTYYTQESNYKHLETLPNIDINIKCGNSLLSKYDLNADIKSILAISGKNTKDYVTAVVNYKNAPNKDIKKEFDLIIEGIKQAISDGLLITQLSRSKAYKDLLTKKQKLRKHEDKALEFSDTPARDVDLEKISELRLEVNKLQHEYDKLRTSKTYDNSFEWRFEFPEVWNEAGDFIGFDLIIGNPPYIQLQANGGLLAEQLKGCGYETFARTGDIYCLFYERGLQLLADNGIVAYITANNWMRAQYGEKLRTFFKSHNPIKLLNLGKGVFNNVTVASNILLLEKTKCMNKLQAAEVKKDQLTDISFTSMEINSEAWIVLSPIEQSIKTRIDQIGVPLKEWGVKVNFGLKTGYNEAFIISSDKRDELLATCKSDEERDLTANIIKPILRGRDIQHYSANWADMWLINTHNGVKGKFSRIDVNKYPSLKTYLDQHIEKLSKRADKGDTPYNLRNCAYLEDLDKDKIVWKRIGSILRFSYEANGSVILDSTCFATGESLKYLVAVLNSKMGNYLFKDAPKTGTGDLLISVQAVNPIKVPLLTEEQQQPFIELVDKILDQKRENPQADTSALEAEIDQMVYALYNLTEEEIGIIESKS